MQTTDAQDTANAAYLKWVGAKHRSQGYQFANDIVEACASEFSKHQNLTENDRAEIYRQVRQSKQRDHDARLCIHGSIACSS
jgi:hypothetical protein